MGVFGDSLKKNMRPALWKAAEKRRLDAEKLTEREREHGELAGEVAEMGEPSMVSSAMGAVTGAGKSGLKATIDLLSRPNFAIAGAADELASGKEFSDALSRAGRELFSGISDIAGDKEGFAQVMEDHGVEQGSSLSDIAPAFFTETGLMKRGGLFDFTQRGVMGFMLDVALDPLTHLTLGASAGGRAVKAGKHWLSDDGIEELGKKYREFARSGIAPDEADIMARTSVEESIDGALIRKEKSKWMDHGGIKMFGQTLVSGKVLRDKTNHVGAALIKFMRSTSMGDKVVDIGTDTYKKMADVGGKLFKRDYSVRAHPEYIKEKQFYLDNLAVSEEDARSMAESIFFGTTEAERKLITRWIDEGMAFQLPNKLKPIADKVGRVHLEIADIERKAGILPDIQMDYILHLWKEHPKFVARAVEALPKRFGVKPGLGGSELRREFQAIRDGINAGLTPETDAAKLFYIRLLRHGNGMITQDFLTKVKGKFGVLPDHINIERGLTTQDMTHISKLMKENVTDKAVIGKLSEAGKAEFLYRRFTRAGFGLEDMEKEMALWKDYEHLFPKTVNKELRRVPMPDGEKHVPLGVGGDDFTDIHVPQSIADDAQTFATQFLNNPEAHKLLRVYDRIANTWKLGVTQWFPAFHFRNAYSNVAQGFLDLGLTMLTPGMHVRAAKIISGHIQGGDNLVSKLGREYSNAEIRYLSKKHGIIVDAPQVYGAIGNKPKPQNINLRLSMGRKLKAEFLEGRGPVGKVGAFIENESRMSMFINYLRRGADPSDAAIKVKKFLFDYQNISEAERGVFVRLFPFWRWTRKNLELQVEQLVTNPGQQAKIAKVLRAEQIDEPELAPSFLRGDTVFQVGTDPVSGNIQTLSGVDFPMSDLNILFDKSPLNTFQKNMGMLGPLPKLVIELGSDTELFTGRKISESSRLRGVGEFIDKAMGESDEWRKTAKWLGFHKVRNQHTKEIEYHFEHPTLLYMLFKSYALSRAYATAERVLDSQRRAKYPWYLDATTGLRLNDVEPDVPLQRRESELTDFNRRKLLVTGRRRKLNKTFRSAESEEHIGKLGSARGRPPADPDKRESKYMEALKALRKRRGR